MSADTTRGTHELTCVECGAISDADANGWRTYLTDDDQPATYCPGCAAAEFGSAS